MYENLGIEIPNKEYLLEIHWIVYGNYQIIYSFIGQNH